MKKNVFNIMLNFLLILLSLDSSSINRPNEIIESELEINNQLLLNELNNIKSNSTFDLDFFLDLTSRIAVDGKNKELDRLSNNNKNYNEVILNQSKDNKTVIDYRPSESLLYFNNQLTNQYLNCKLVINKRQLANCKIIIIQEFNKVQSTSKKFNQWDINNLSLIFFDEKNSMISKLNISEISYKGIKTSKFNYLTKLSNPLIQDKLVQMNYNHSTGLNILELPNESEHKTGYVNFINLSGQLVRKVHFQGLSCGILLSPTSLNDLSDGVYFIMLTDENQIKCSNIIKLIISK